VRPAILQSLRRRFLVFTSESRSHAFIQAEEAQSNEEVHGNLNAGRNPAFGDHGAGAKLEQQHDYEGQ